MMAREFERHRATRSVRDIAGISAEIFSGSVL
jgi:hypothetical protein